MSTAPNMATITASLERSLQNCSLSHPEGGGGAAGCPESPPSPTLELNSQGALPFHWEQCLDLKTGEVYYINWRTVAKAPEDPRTSLEYYSDSDDESSYDGKDGSSSKSSECSGDDQELCPHRENNEIEEPNNTATSGSSNVLVVAGCKSFLMYYMVPKQAEIFPPCSAGVYPVFAPPSVSVYI